MRHGCSAPRAKFRVLDWDAGWIWAWRPLLFHARALSLICTGMDDGGDQVFGRGTSEHEFFTPFGWQNLATWRNCVFRHDISELGNMSLDEFGEDTLLLSLFHQESFGLLRICRILECLIPLDG